jgi:pyruvate kinase
MLREAIQSYEEMVRRAAGGVLGAGDILVVAAGMPFGPAGTTNNLCVVSVSCRCRLPWSA